VIKDSESPFLPFLHKTTTRVKTSCQIVADFKASIRMRLSTLFLLSRAFPGLLPAQAAKHHLFVGTFQDRALYALEFDDVNLALTLTTNISASDTHTWITLSHNCKALYGSGIGSGAWYSYTINNSSSITPSGAVPLKGNCISALPGVNAGNGPSGLHSVAGSTPPYAFYGAGPTCGNVLSVDPTTSALLSVSQEIPYSFNSTTFSITSTLMHGFALSADGRFLYGVDTRGNSLWIYSVDKTTGHLNLISAMPGPVPGANPRHVATHPSGGYLYVALEGANALTQYKVDKKTGLPARESTSYPLIKPGLNPSAWWPDEVMISHSAKYLWATNRGRQAGTKGFISAFRLGDSGEIERQLFLMETTTSGGSANAVTPAPFGDEWVALTDTEKGLVQIWRFDVVKEEVEVVAEVGIPVGRCCANAVWYD